MDGKLNVDDDRDGTMSVQGQRLGSGDGEHKTLLTRQIAFEPLPASVLFGLVGGWWLLMMLLR